MKDKAGRPINPLFSILSQKVSYKNRKNRGTRGTRVETRGFLPPRRRNAATPPNQGGELKRSCKNRENCGTRLGRVLGRPGTLDSFPGVVEFDIGILGCELVAGF